MNEYELQIFVDSDTVSMIQHFTDSGININIDRLLSLMADNAESISDFIQSIECDEPRMVLPIADSNMKRLIIEETNQYSVSPEKISQSSYSTFVF